MTFGNNTFQLSATDLSNHLSCRHLTELDRKVALGELKRPHWNDPQLEILIQRGHDHEKAYVGYLKSLGKIVVEGGDVIAAMKLGVDVIVQAGLELNQWNGLADILIKVPGKSKFGDWQYEVQDTKLAQNTKAGTILQLCLYSDLLAELQGASPEKFHVIKPVENFEPESYRFDDFKAYYRATKKNFERAMSEPAANTYPEPVEHCGICRWWKVCDTRRHNDDYISLVAGIRSAQIEELKTQGVRKLEDFAKLEKIVEPKRGNIDTYIRRQSQAKVQLEGRTRNEMIHHVIQEVEEGLGLNRLPEPNAGDVHFDIEGDAYYPGGLEYMLGYAYREDGNLVYKNFRATNRTEEKIAFGSFMKFLTERRVKFPEFSIYHFAPYESIAIKRLASVHSIFEQEVDELLRGERFIDLHAVFKESLLASVERYSLKDLEKFTTYTRKIDLHEAGIARKNLECVLELNLFSSVSKETLSLVEGYNEDDCLATEALHVWLEKLRGNLIQSGIEFKRPFPKENEPDKELLEREKQSLRLYEGLISTLPPDRAQWTDEDHARWLLAHQLNYFRREDKSAWWEFFRLQKMEDEDAFAERKAITGLKFLEAFPGKKKNSLPSHKYSFPPQEVGITPGDSLVITNSVNPDDRFGITFGTVEDFNMVERTITVKKTKKALELHPKSVHLNDRIGPGALWMSILSLAKEVEQDGLAHAWPFHASKDLLMRRRPRLLGGKEGADLLPGEDVVAAAIRIALCLDKSILPIQGPPGAGKTTTAAKMIIALLKQYKKIGVTAISHRVIINLFEKVKELADKENFKIEFAHRGDDLDFAPEWLDIMKNTDAVLKAIEAGRPVGGTAWLWASDNVVDKLDYLFIDEAGQMSLSQALSASRAAKNIILLGDPQQLEQPQKGSHPEGSDVAALTHLIGDHQAMPPEQGLFLEFTYRLHPKISAFTSELFYEGRLKSKDGLEKQVVSGGTQFDGAGLFYVPVNHVGNQNVSLEEVEEIGKIVEQLLTSGSWTDSDNVTRKLNKNDILIVAPYNAQVAALIQKMPGIQIGTVDKFQGKEAPVVIYSMTSSSQEDAPRGMSFLFSPNRLNVATSRAKSVSILVASPRLLEPDCKTIDQMKWANGLCRYVEMVK